MNTRKRKLKFVISSDSESDYEKPIKVNKNNIARNIKKGKQDIKTKPTRSFKIENNETASTSQKSKLHIKEEPTSTDSDSGIDYILNIKKEKSTTKHSAKKVTYQTELRINAKSENKESCWQSHELLSEYQDLDLNVAESIIHLFDEGCTIPFIARYRKDVTNNMTPEVLREVKENYDKINTLKSRGQTVLNCLEKSGNLDNNLKKAILSARTIEEVEHIYAPFKPGGKKTLAERARALGLQQPAEDILENKSKIQMHNYIDKSNSELDTYDKVEKGIMHIIAHIISTDIKVLTFFRKLKTEGRFTIEVKKLNKRNIKTKNAIAAQVDESKYENYFDFKMPVQFVKPHQVLAINRGESQKILSVKINVPEFVLKRFTEFCRDKFTYYSSDKVRRKILDESITDSYTRLMQPLLVREIRGELKYTAEKASYEVFCSNLKQLLLTPPIKGRSILGIDPGFSNGCKLALISPTGTFLTSAVLYLQDKMEKQAKVLKNMLQQHNCTLIALGNGTACRETETWLSDLIGQNCFSPLDVSYIIVNENGASIYSCSLEAKKEFPNMDPNIISSVSLARRIQEPLAEFVKVEPKHLGVGMYQHDLPKKKLEEALDEVVSECVSFVGVDLNTASQCLLRRIAGLSDKRATKIIEYRDSKGPFLNRKGLLKITGIGAKIFEQCAGFLRVGPITIEEECEFYKNPDTNKLDCTIIHPESYNVTSKIVKQFNLTLKDIGTPSFINTIKGRMENLRLVDLCETFNTSEQTLKLIFDALSKPLNYDLRNDCSKVPLFKKGITSLSDLQIGTVLTGRVSNNTHFGSFIDIGVGCNGLVHISKMRGQSLEVGNIIEVRVLSIEIQRKRIGLELVRIM